MFVNVFYPSNRKNIAKSVTILKLCKRSFRWDLAECPSFIRLEMAWEWRQVVRNLKIHHRIFMFLLCLNIETKRIKLKIRSWRHFKENLKLFNLIMDIMKLWRFWVVLLRKTSSWNDVYKPCMTQILWRSILHTWWMCKAYWKGGEGGREEKAKPKSINNCSDHEMDKS